MEVGVLSQLGGGPNRWLEPVASSDGGGREEVIFTSIHRGEEGRGPPPPLPDGRGASRLAVKGAVQTKRQRDRDRHRERDIDRPRDRETE